MLGWWVSGWVVPKAVVNRSSECLRKGFPSMSRSHAEERRGGARAARGDRCALRPDVEDHTSPCIASRRSVSLPDSTRCCVSLRVASRRIALALRRCGRRRAGGGSARADHQRVASDGGAVPEPDGHHEERTLSVRCGCAFPPCLLMTAMLCWTQRDAEGQCTVRRGATAPSRTPRQTCPASASGSSTAPSPGTHSPASAEMLNDPLRNR